MTESQALHRLAVYCSRAERCESDVRKKLTLWELSDDEKSRIVSRLFQEKFLDEDRYAKAFVKDKSRFGKWGKLKIQFELKKKRIPDSIIKAAIADLEDEETEKVLMALLTRKNALVKAKDDRDRRTKLIRFAAGKGFQMNEILSCLNRITKAEDEFME